jgi:hypothetical protein
MSFNLSKVFTAIRPLCRFNLQSQRKYSKLTSEPTTIYYLIIIRNVLGYICGPSILRNKEDNTAENKKNQCELIISIYS